MPHLSARTRRKLKYLPQEDQAPHGAAALACWNWALTGFRPMQKNPDDLFNFVSVGILYPAAGWYNIAANQNSLAALRAQWLLYDNALNESPQRLQVLHTINTELVKLSASLNGLVVSAAPTPYEVVMYYHPTTVNTHRVTGVVTTILNGPNYSHWWLQIDGGGLPAHNDGLEVFPGGADLCIRRPEYSSSAARTCRVYVQQLHQDHVNRIDAVLTTILNQQHGAAPAHGAWVNANRCSICNSTVYTGITRHHCRCCGRTVCADCSPATRVALLNARAPVAKPNQVAGAGPHRVCLYC
jgi:hypothetical protein